MIEEHNHVPERGTFDVIVAGGGVAGVAAAVTARRAGKSVLLLEKSVMLGGLATLGLINFFVPMCNGRGKQVIRGMAEELLRLSIRDGYDSLPEAWRDGEPKGETLTRYVTRYSANIFALDLTELVTSLGVELSYDTVAAKPVMDGSRCEGLMVENKSGRGFYRAGVVVDATGDADILYRAGVPTVQGGNWFTYIGHAITLESCRAAAESGDIGKAVTSRCGGGSTLYGGGHPEGMPRFDGTSAESVNEFLIRNQSLMLANLRKEDRLSREVVMLPGMAQFRTTRHIDGDYTLTEADTYRHFKDSVCAICDFDRRDFLFEVPLRAMTRRGFDNLVTAGRSVSAEGYAWDVVRVIPPAILTGQAAGQIAAMALDSGRAVSEVDVPALQEALTAQDVLIHFDDAWVPKGAKPDADARMADHM